MNLEELRLLNNYGFKLSADIISNSLGLIETYKAKKYGFETNFC